MKYYLKAYKITLQTEGPVFVGSGKELSKKEYMFMPGHKIGVIDIAKLYQVVKKHRLQSKFEEYMVMDSRTDLGQWLKQNRIEIKEITPCMRYVLDNGDTVLQKGNRTQIMECIKDAYGLPYIPGSSIKGMLRTILLANELMEKPEYFKEEIGLLKNNYPFAEKNRNTYLQRNIKQIEARAFCTLNKKDTKPTDAVNDILSGFIVGDSDVLSMEDIVLCQKVERHVDGTEKTLNLLRECIKPDREITFQVSIDESTCGVTIDQVLDAISRFNDCYYACFLSSFKEVESIQEDTVYLGGGCGFVSKTVGYPIFGKREGIAFAQKVFEQTHVPREHKHYKDRELGVSPHILKCTKYNGRTLQMGLCKIKAIKALS